MRHFSSCYTLIFRLSILVCLLTITILPASGFADDHFSNLTRNPSSKALKLPTGRYSVNAGTSNQEFIIESVPGFS
ncbi:MAG: hypothetical protein NTV34_21700, partial [Proteobacteria bacterium]|nr:hypothetical protein [Pseudomonadota bacterium]